MKKENKKIKFCNPHNSPNCEQCFAVSNECLHDFRLANFGQEQTGGTSWKYIAYTCCVHCGEVRKQEIK